MLYLLGRKTGKVIPRILTVVGIMGDFCEYIFLSLKEHVDDGYYLLRTYHMPGIVINSFHRLSFHTPAL